MEKLLRVALGLREPQAQCVNRHREQAADTGEQAQAARRGHGLPATLDRHDEKPDEHEDHDEGGVAPAPEERHSDDRDEVERSESTRRPARGEQEEGHRDDIERSREKQRAHAAGTRTNSSGAASTSRAVLSQNSASLLGPGGQIALI